MLRASKKILFAGESVIGETVVCTFNATIDCANPQHTTAYQTQKDREAYAANRETCRKDFAEFEDVVLAHVAKLTEGGATEEKE